MTRFTLLKFVLAGIGIVVWGYGARVENAHARLAGIIVFAVAFFLRFLPARLRQRLDGVEPGAERPES